MSAIDEASVPTPSPEPVLIAAAKLATIKLVSMMQELHRQTRPRKRERPASGQASEQAVDRAPSCTDATLFAVLDELLRPELPQPQPHADHRLRPQSPPQAEQQPEAQTQEEASGATVEAGPAAEVALVSPESVAASNVGVDWSCWWEQSGIAQQQQWQQGEELEEPPPLSVGPCGLSHPGYLPEGYLRRPYALQLAWAAAVWRVTGRFPYPVVQQRRPPLLQEGDAYRTALAEVEALLLPLLLPETESPERAAVPLPMSADHRPPPPTAAADPAQACVAESPGEAPAPAQQELRPGAADPETTVEPVAPAAVALTSGASAIAAAAAAAAAADKALRRLLLSAPAVYLMLGFRLTAGSASKLVALPSLRECWEAFERRHAPPCNASVLTVGARALTKHTHRDLRGEWWPRMSGSEATKNEMARGSLRRLLGGALWLNVHQLPPFDAPKYVLEIRNAQGYGARWAVEDSQANDSTAAPPPRPAQRAASGPEEAVVTGVEAAATDAAAGAQGRRKGCDEAERFEPSSALEATREAAVRSTPQPQAPVLATAAAEAGPSTPLVVLTAGGTTPCEAVATAGSATANGGVAQRPRVQFRGFLEPQMEGGHDVGWRH